MSFQEEYNANEIKGYAYCRYCQTIKGGVSYRIQHAISGQLIELVSCSDCNKLNILIIDPAECLVQYIQSVPIQPPRCLSKKYNVLWQNAVTLLPVDPEMSLVSRKTNKAASSCQKAIIT